MGINYVISVIELKQIHKDLERIANALEVRNDIDLVESEDAVSRQIIDENTDNYISKGE